VNPTPDIIPLPYIRLNSPGEYEVEDVNQVKEIGWVELAAPPTSELPVRDELDKNRRVWRKGRMEWMGGPTYFTQGHDHDGYEDNNRLNGYLSPNGMCVEKIVRDIGTDMQEQ
jgi:hypothetical protein